MKITVIGSGSIFFTRQLVNGMVRSETFKGCELGLVDLDERKCEQMAIFCRKMVEEHGADIKISASTDRKEILPGSDYVILTFAIRNYLYRETGTLLAKTYGINMVSGETTGPSSVFRILRTVPAVLEVARDIETLCPDAMVLNYVNPTNVVGTALVRFTKLKSYAFCDGLYERHTVNRIATYLDLRDEITDINQLEFKIGGINHFTWMWELTRQGEDMMPRFREGLRREGESKTPVFPEAVCDWEVFKVFGVWPAAIDHAPEYLRYFKGLGKDPSRDYQVTKWNLNKRINWMKRVWREIKACNEGKITASEVVKSQGDGSDMLLTLIESILTDKKARFPVNIPNEGRIPNLPDDALVEIYGTFGRDGVDVPVIGDLPRGPWGITCQIIDEQELALEAAMTGNFKTVVKSIACDPAVMSLNDAIDIAHDFMALESADLDSRWEPYWEERDND